MKVGTRVLRINQDNFPVSRAGNIGVVCADTPETIKYFGPIANRPGFVLVDFGKEAFHGMNADGPGGYTGPTPNNAAHIIMIMEVVTPV